MPAVLRRVGVAETEPERVGRPVQQRPEHTRRIRARQAQPLDRPVRRDQAALLTIGQEPVIGNPRRGQITPLGGYLAATLRREC